MTSEQKQQQKRYYQSLADDQLAEQFLEMDRSVNNCWLANQPAEKFIEMLDLMREVIKERKLKITIRIITERR